MSEVLNIVYCVKYQYLIDFENVSVNLKRKIKLH
jgi:hypothetical protein